MKSFFFLLFTLISFTTFSQELNDRIYPKEGDSIKCKITSVQKNWIYYDHMGKKGIRNDYIHMSDLKFYLYNGVKRKSYEYETTSNFSKIINLDSLQDTAPKDTVKTCYLDSLNKKYTCLILLNKKSREINLLKKIRIIDSLGKLKVFFPNQISGYWLDGIYYKSFKTNYNGKNIFFFAEELSKGKASLYLYNGEQINNESIYIFKKQSEIEFNFVKEHLTKRKEFGTTSISLPQTDGDSSGPAPISFYDEEPYLNYFQSYLSDCKEVDLKFKSKWYTFNSVTTMFNDYNKCQ